jgi:flagellar motor switch protein FliM
MSAHDLVRLKQGDTLSLGQPANAALEVLIGSTPKFRGRLVERDGRGVIVIVETITTGARAEGATR